MGLAQYDYDEEEVRYLADIEEELQERADQQAYKKQTLGKQRKEMLRKTNFPIAEIKNENSLSEYVFLSREEKIKKFSSPEEEEEYNRQYAKWPDPSLHSSHFPNMQPNRYPLHDDSEEDFAYKQMGKILEALGEIVARHGLCDIPDECK